MEVDMDTKWFLDGRHSSSMTIEILGTFGLVQYPVDFLFHFLSVPQWPGASRVEEAMLSDCFEHDHGGGGPLTKKVTAGPVLPGYEPMNMPGRDFF